MISLFLNYINKKRIIQLSILIFGLVLSFFLFPVVSGFLVQPYVITLHYNVKTEGTYSLKFDKFIFQDPSTVFYSPSNNRTELLVTNKGNNPISCWISNYNYSNTERLLGIYLPVLDQSLSSDRPGQLLDNEGNLGAANQPYRTFYLKVNEEIGFSFHGTKRVIECPQTTKGTQINVLIDGVINIDHHFSKESPSLDVYAIIKNNQKIATLSVPPYAFGKFYIIGPEGFLLNQGSLKRIKSSEQLPFGEIPFPFFSFFITLIVSFLLSLAGFFFIRHSIFLFKQECSNKPKRDTPFFSLKDFWFLLVSGLTVMTFTGSVPPIHMFDSMFYTETAARIYELFSTFMYAPYRNPGYMIFIWLTRKLMGPGYGLILVQEFLFFITAFLLFKTVEYFTQGNSFAAWCAGLIYIFNPLNLIYSQFIQPEGFWRDLIIIWAFSLILVMKRKNWAGLVSGIALGILLLSRNSALPSIILFVAIGSLVAWRRIPLRKYLPMTIILIVLIYSPYYFYLHVSKTQSQAYVSSLHHFGQFSLYNRTLDVSSSCFTDFQEDFAIQLDKGLNLLPWMKEGFFSPLNVTVPQLELENQKAILFERCVYSANYLRFPKQQIAVLEDRTLSYLWKDDLKDMDLFDYGKIYSNDFISANTASIYQASNIFEPYFYSEKWNVQNYDSAWKFLFEFLYSSWSKIELIILIFCAISVLTANNYVYITTKVSPFQGITLLITALSMPYFADAILYSVFGMDFSRRLMIAVAPLMIMVFGLSLGVWVKIIKKWLSKNK